jgi:poly-beta-1,6-N-acetyl-D-glucosamine synthase
LLNFTKHFFLSLQYFSHKVLRWTLVPVSLVLVFLLNCLIFIRNSEFTVYSVLLVLQVFFYLTAIMGSLYRQKLLRFKLLFAPFYVCMMNYAILLGFLRFLSHKQQAAWEKSKRNSG